jgi:hypothetical protein
MLILIVKIIIIIWTKCLCPSKIHMLMPSLVSSVSIFRDEDFQEVIKIKQSHKGGALTQ